MNNPARLGLIIHTKAKSLANFFQFIGHLASSAYWIGVRKHHFPWRQYFLTIYRAGARMAVPTMLFCIIFCYLSIDNFHPLANKFNIKNELLSTFVHTVTIRILPPLITTFICVHAALDFINHKIDHKTRSPTDILVQQILPSILGIIFATLWLYTYCFIACLSGIFMAYARLEHFSFPEYLIMINNSISLYDVLSALQKTLFFSIIAAMTVAYYHYQIASKYLALRMGISRVITRGITWIIITALYFNLLT